MCNLSKGIWDKGIAQGMEKGKILGAIEVYRSIGMTDEQISDKLVELFNLSKDDANNYAVSHV